MAGNQAWNDTTVHLSSGSVQEENRYFAQTFSRNAADGAA
jgi:hypothetical protein